MIQELDWSVGELLETLDRLELADNTIVIFSSDNGASGRNFNGHSANGRLRGGKGDLTEGGHRVPFIVRWPGRITAGQVNDEIVHLVDLFPTLAAIAGGRVPADRAIDGIDMTDFLLGRRVHSGREGFVVYMGNEIFGVKWRNWKLHFKEQDSAFGELRTYTMPRAYNLLTDPQERDNVLFPSTWVPKAALRQLDAHVASLRAHPPIPTGTPDPYIPE